MVFVPFSGCILSTQSVLDFHPPSQATTSVSLSLLHSLAELAKCLCPEYALQENYWIHVELFPETASLYSSTALNELQVIFLHARAGEAGNPLIDARGCDRQYLDALTSDTPTFPYTAKQSEEFIDLLQRGKGVSACCILHVLQLTGLGRSCFQPLHHYLRRKAMGNCR